MRAALLFSLAMLAGCAGGPRVLEQSSYWPFDRVRLQTAAVGPLTVYSHRAAQASRTMVILQSPPCVKEPVTPADPALSTGGLFWDDVKADSLLLQLERPGGFRDGMQAPAPDCTPELREKLPVQRWEQAVTEVLSFMTRQREPRLPTVYLGIGQGALPAARLAARDERATLLVIVNGTGLNPGFEALLAGLRTDARTHVQDLLDGSAVSLRVAPTTATPQTFPIMPVRSTLTTLLVQSTANQESRLESSLLLLARLEAAGARASMLVIEGQGTDFGLSTGEPDCFENVMRLIAQRARSPGSSGAPLTRVDCSAGTTSSEQ